MAILKWLLFAVAKILVYLLALIITPLLVLFEEDGWLPNWASWFQTHDNSLDGDKGWRTEHLLFLNPKGDEWDALRIYLKRVLWLYRNPCYGFARDVLGANLEDDNFIIAIYGDRRTSNSPGHSGWLLRKLYLYSSVNLLGADYWQFYYVRQWGNTAKCLRINLGWKLWGDSKRRQFVLSLNPFSSFV